MIVEFESVLIMSPYFSWSLELSELRVQDRPLKKEEPEFKLRAFWGRGDVSRIFVPLFSTT